MQKNIQRVQNKRSLIIAFIIILLLWIGVAVFMDIEEQWLLDKIVLRYGIYFSWLLIVAFTGYIAWKKQSPQWIPSLWLMVYTAVVFLLLLAGFIDVFIYAFNVTAKMYIQSFRLFFLSPVPFVLLYFFSTLGKKNIQ